MIQELETKTIIIFDKKYETFGHRPHLVIADDHCKYVLKCQNHRNDKDSVVKEFLCSFLLDYWEVFHPKCYELVAHDEFPYETLISIDKRFKFNRHFFGSAYLDNCIDLSPILP